MQRFLMISRFLSPDGAGSGAGGDGSGPGGSGQSNAPAAGDGSAPAAAAQAGDAAGAAGGAPAGGDYWPEGLDPSFKGADSKTTLDNIAKRIAENQKALDGYRQLDSKRDVVKTFEEMVDFGKIPDFKIEEKNQPYFDALKSDPLFKTVAEAAIKDGIGRRAVGNLYQNFLNAASEAGLLEPPIDPKAERAALLPDTAKSLDPKGQDAAIDKRMQENYDFLSLASQNMGLPAEAGKYAELMLGDSAKGHQFFEWVRGLSQGGGNGPNGGGGGSPAGGVTRESLRAEQAAVEALRGQPGYEEKAKALDAKYKQFYGD
jgi:hypothetical protein